MGGASERAPSSPSGLGFYSPDTHVLPCRGAGCRGVDYGSSATVRHHGAHDQMQPSGLRAQPTSPDLDNRMPQCLPSALLLPEDERHACACVCAHVVTHACVCVCASASVWATVASRQMSRHRRTNSLPLCCSVPSTPTLPSHLPLERRAPMSDFTQWKGLKYIALDQRVHYGPAGVPRGPFLRRVWEQAHGRPLVATRGTQSTLPSS